MEYATRLANPDVAQCYPLPVSGSANWTPIASADGSPGWMYELELPDLPSGHVIVPSFARHDDDPDYSFQFSLLTSGQELTSGQASGQEWRLNSVPAEVLFAESKAKKNVGKSNNNVAISCHIDCWHSEQPIRSPRIRLSIKAKSIPTRYLLTVTVRVLEQTAQIETSHHNICVQVPASFSQMQAAADLKQRICSPTALAMALSVFDSAPNWHDTVQACYDPQTRAYGAWPLAIHWASRQGILGAVEALNGWHEAVEVLQTGTPLVCSISFAKGKLEGAPLTQTGGHLVMLYGLAGDKVLVRDPAGETDKTVDRSYSMQEFTEAWLRRRGAAYIFCKDIQDN